MKTQNIFSRGIAGTLLVILLMMSVSGCSGSNEKPVDDSATRGVADGNISASENSAEDELSEGDSSQGQPEQEVLSTEQNDVHEEEDKDELTQEQRNMVNILNYMTILAQRANETRGNRIILESIYNSFDNLSPDQVDAKTTERISELMDTIAKFRMVGVKRERLDYIYEKTRAQALLRAFSDTLELLGNKPVQQISKDIFNDAAMAISTAVYLSADVASNYLTVTSEAEDQFIRSGWDLDDAESEELHNNFKRTLIYIFDIVNEYGLPGKYTVSSEDVERFVEWSEKSDSQLEAKISWFESAQDTYSEMGPYWLELAKCYYYHDDYAKCLEALNRYESISTDIFRRDTDYASALPAAIISSRETMSTSDYVKAAANYCDQIMKNTKDQDWELRYFAAQTYVDLYAAVKEDTYLRNAYDIIFQNAVILVDEQKELNKKYMGEVEEKQVPQDATARVKEEIAQYNELLREERKTALPPVSEALYLNCELLFALAEKTNVESAEKEKIDRILHVDGERLFLTKEIDDLFWFNNPFDQVIVNSIEVSLDKGRFTIPAAYVSDQSSISGSIAGTGVSISVGDWLLVDVNRPAEAADCEEFIATFESKAGNDYKYNDGDTMVIKVNPIKETEGNDLEFKYNAVAIKKFLVLDGIEFERENL